jgi:formylglycine-generating enzyme required for sulfatase activity
MVWHKIARFTFLLPVLSLYLCLNGTKNPISSTPSLSIPVPALPTSGTTGQPTTLSLTWGTVTGATSYSVRLSTVSTFSSTVQTEAGLTTASDSLSGLSTGTTYYWEVRAADTAVSGGWSGAWNFTTATPVAVPVLSSPSNGAANQATALAVAWGTVTGATSYSVQVSTVSTFSSTIVNRVGLTNTSDSITGLVAGTAYYWEVNATNSVGSGAWSAPWSFATIPAIPAAPTLSSPTSGSANQAITPTLAWGTVSNAASYGIMVSTTSTFATTVTGQSGLTTPAATPGGLANSTTYYWEANATGAGGTGTWSGIWNFTTVVAAPVVPTLVSPTNGAGNEPASLLLAWTTVSNAATYAVQVSTGSAFGSTVTAQIGLTGASAAVTGLAGTTTYYWRAGAKDAGGVSGWSGVWNFTTGASSATLPLMMSIPAGTFLMGDTNTQLLNAGSASTPVHSVTLGAFTMSQTLVTQAQYQSMMGVNPSSFDSGSTWPVESVNWYDAVWYCNKLSKLAGLDTVYTYTGIYQGSGYDTLASVAIDYSKNGYRLPTEAEFEYANRAGRATDYYWGRNYPPMTTADTLAIDSNAVWYYNSPASPQPVAKKLPNAWGLYDMSGNLWEWCNDWYGGYGATNQTNPTGAASGSSRVQRGGSWDDSTLVAAGLCAAYRNGSATIGANAGGFRVVIGAR